MTDGLKAQLEGAAEVERVLQVRFQLSGVADILAREQNRRSRRKTSNFGSQLCWAPGQGQGPIFGAVAPSWPGWVHLLAECGGHRSEIKTKP